MGLHEWSHDQQTYCKREECVMPTTRTDDSNARRGSHTACHLEQESTATKFVEDEDDDVAEALPPGGIYLHTQFQ
jgi:hypothetical protein